MITEGAYPALLITEAREWIADVVGNPDDVEGARVRDVLTFVEDRYEGGMRAFYADGNYYDGSYGS